VSVSITLHCRWFRGCLALSGTSPVASSLLAASVCYLFCLSCVLSSLFFSPACFLVLSMYVIKSLSHFLLLYCVALHLVLFCSIFLSLSLFGSLCPPPPVPPVCPSSHSSLSHLHSASPSDHRSWTASPLYHCLCSRAPFYVSSLSLFLAFSFCPNYLSLILFLCISLFVLRATSPLFSPVYLSVPITFFCVSLPSSCVLSIYPPFPPVCPVVKVPIVFAPSLFSRLFCIFSSLTLWLAPSVTLSLFLTLAQSLSVPLSLSCSLFVSLSFFLSLDLRI